MAGIKTIINLFKKGNVSICGKKGRGKDMLTANVIARRKLPYVSNINYGGNYIPFNFADFDTNNTYDNFISGNVNYYKFPFPDKTDVYLSDCGLYFPSQEQKELCKRYDSFIPFMALSRQLGLCNVHTNAQYLNRVWDKLREQSDLYIGCQSCKVLFGKFVFQKVRVYEKYESALNNVAPFRMNVPLFVNRQTKLTIDLAKTSYINTHGVIKTLNLFYINKSDYDTRFFKKYLLGGKKL